MPKRKEPEKGTERPPVARQETFADNPNGEVLRELQAKGKGSTGPKGKVARTPQFLASEKKGFVGPQIWKSSRGFCLPK